ncbi:DNA-protecting protein DprA [Chlorobium sp. BLA1]|uniref:DNA-processing protein DprA n=1 Tax=Candidatus Chlorobium masyuteum TaxID=2716876 RepID=UPI00141E7223|nr:DNA-processing protein DprA [Candidatus Chlorobium masyuteum]NHQ59917.1 DNA-protecting protein DprA [Candidatus Chlorobium masyuteum]
MEKSMLLLALTLIPGIGPSRIKALINQLPDIIDVLQADVEELKTIPGIGEPLARQIHDFLAHSETRASALNTAEEQIAALHRCNAKLLTILDPDYPPLLKEIYDPPPCLFIRGTMPDPHTPGIAVVGTRKASPYGKECTEKLCQGLVSLGAVIFSGMAYGIDMTAHLAALKHGGTTVAVLASGVDTIYTDPQGKVWPKIVEHGALISEEWIGSSLSPGKFPKRNRIISGISAGTLVTESDLKGGALITAANALEQNREVFAVPGSIFSRSSRGTNRLIQQGQAKAVMCVEDIITELWPHFANTLPETAALPPDNLYLKLNDHERAILERMTKEPVHIDTLAAETGMDVSSLLVHLFELELKTAIMQMPEQFFRKI